MRAKGYGLSSQQACISLALRAPYGTLHRRGVLSEFRAARTCASYWFDKAMVRASHDSCFLLFPHKISFLDFINFRFYKSQFEYFVLFELRCKFEINNPTVFLKEVGEFILVGAVSAKIEINHCSFKNTFQNV